MYLSSKLKKNLLVVGLTFVLLPWTGWGDEVFLTSGRTIEGIVVRDTEAEVEISFGVGSVTVPRSQILRVDRSSEEDRTALQDTFDQQRIEQIKRQPPDALKPLDGRLKRLKEDRAKAKKAVLRVGSIDKGKDKLETRERKGEKEYRKLNNKLATLSPRTQYAEYTATLEKVNRAAALTNETRAKLRDNEELKKKLKSKITLYMEDLAAFEGDLARAEYVASRDEETAGDERTTNWLARAASQLAVLRSDFKTMHIRTEAQGNSQTVSALINDKVAGTFIVDTGASVVTLSASMAKRLGISYASRPSAQMTMANGSSVTGYPIQLRSMAVGEAKAWNVRAVVIEQPPGPGVDGLLGMTFLGEFSMSFNAQTGLLELKSFGAKSR